MVGVICVFLLSCSDKKTKENDRWVIFGFTENGSLYYDKMSVTNESQKIIKVWSKLKYSKVGKVMSFNAAMPSGARGRYFNELCGLNVLYSSRHSSINTWASFKV